MEDDRTSIMTARALSPGHEILWYEIERVLGQGGFGITYLAHDRNLDRSVAIKEYLPTPFAYRHRDYSVKPLTGDHRDQFIWGLDSFQKEAQTLAKFGHDNIVRVHSVFEQNNTAYMVMEYEDGENLAAVYQKKRGALDQDFFEQVFFPIFDGLKEIHKFGFIHRDIKPANIYIRDNRTPVLIDFGSARETSRQETGQMTTLVTQGYTPLEQYNAQYGEQGPWTDIYALAATMYEGVVGKKPEESLSRSACMMRSAPDLIQPLSTNEYPAFTQPFLNALISGLALEPERRPIDLNHWLGEFFSSEATLPSRPAKSISGFSDDDRTRIRPNNPNQRGASRGNQARETPAPKPREDSLTRILQVAHSPTQSGQGSRGRDDQFDMGLDDMSFLDRTTLHTGSDAAFDSGFDTDDDFTGTTAGSGTKQSTKKSRPRLVLGIVAVALLAGIVGAGGYFYTNSRVPGVAESRINAATLAALPTPSLPVNVILPKDLVMQQLTAMQTMTQLYKDALQIDPDNAELNRSIDQTYTRLTRLARHWNASSHPAVRQKIVQVANQIPNRGQQKSEIMSLLENSDNRSNTDQLEQQLDAGNISTTGNGSILELVNSLSQQDFGRISQTEQWQTLIGQFRQIALEKIKASEFEVAATYVAAGLSMQPGDDQLGLLRGHLQQL